MVIGIAINKGLSLFLKSRLPLLLSGLPLLFLLLPLLLSTFVVFLLFQLFLLILFLFLFPLLFFFFFLFEPIHFLRNPIDVFQKILLVLVIIIQPSESIVVVIELVIKLLSLQFNLGYLRIVLSLDILRSSFFGDLLNFTLLLVLDHIELCPDVVGLSDFDVQLMLNSLELLIENALLVFKFSQFGLDLNPWTSSWQGSLEFVDFIKQPIFLLLFNVSCGQIMLFLLDSLF